MAKSPNEFYEKHSDGTETQLADLPFDIPTSWTWCRLGEIVLINPRNKIDDEQFVSFISMSMIRDGYNNSHSYEVRKWKDVKSGFTHIKEGDVAVAKITPCFENLKSVVFRNLKNGYGAATTELHVLRDFSNMLEKIYLLIFCKSPLFILGGCKTYTGTAGQQRVRKDYIVNSLFALPSNNEQKRIVHAIKSLFAIIDTLIERV